jgi:fimbrial chaperone protein
MRGRVLAAVIAVLCAFSAPAPLSAQSSVGVEPLLLEVRPGASAAMRMRNNGQSPSTVEVRVFERLIDENGVQTRRDADDDFLIFPPQAIVAPQSLQVFRLQPLNPAEAQSRSYFVSIRQVPVVLPTVEGETGARVQLLFAFDSAVHVVPNGAVARPVLVSAEPGRVSLQIQTGERRPLPEGGDEPIVETREYPAISMVVRNDGNKFFYLQNMNFTGEWTDAAGTAQPLPAYTQDQIIQAAGVTLVPPGATRRFALPLPEGSQVASVRLEMSAAAQR